jgi:processive 1,2-diacylglycerol beta-glucosyltransferase
LEDLEQSLKSKYSDKVEIYGFTKNIQDLMFDSDIAFTRGSPNVMFEAFSSNTPIIITGALPGQERDNPAFAEKLNLGVICKDKNEIQQTINQLLENDAEKLKKQILELTLQSNLNIISLQSQSNSLEEVFRQLVER